MKPKNNLTSDKDVEMQHQKDIHTVQKAAMLIEDIAITLRSQRMSVLEDALKVLIGSSVPSKHKSQLSKQYESEDPNKHFLIGVLPRLFQDKALFPINDDIVEFANTALGLYISKSSRKRSRYKIIGNVICEADSLDEFKLTSLVRALEKLVGNKDILNKTIARKKLGDFSWNETIQELLSN